MSRIAGDAETIRGLVPAARASWRLIDETVIRAGEIGEDAFGGYGDRERVALEWARAIAWDSDRADDALWSRLHALFTEPELVDLGCAIGFELGQQHWRRTVGLSAR